MTENEPTHDSQNACPFCTLQETRKGSALIPVIFLMPVLLLLLAIITVS